MSSYACFSLCFTSSWRSVVWISFISSSNRVNRYSNNSDNSLSLLGFEVAKWRFKRKSGQSGVTDDSFVFKLRNEFFDRFTANNGFYKQAFRGARFAFLMVFAFDKARGRTLQT